LDFEGGKGKLLRFSRTPLEFTPIKPQLQADFARRLPVIDGKSDDLIWQQSKNLQLEIPSDQTKQLNDNGNAKIAWRDNQLWIMAEFEDADIVALGKGIGSGVSVSAVCSTTDIFSCLAKGEMSSTYGGNPVSSAAVTAVLEIFENENLVENSAKIGEYMKGELQKIAAKCPYLGDVRGMGLVMGLEFVKDKTTKEPAPQLIKPIIDKCAQSGLLVGSVGMYGNVLRVAPPLVITKELADESLAIMENVLKDIKL